MLIFVQECTGKNVKLTLPDDNIVGLLGAAQNADNENPVSDLIFIEEFVGIAKLVQSDLLKMDKNNDKLKGIIKE